MIKPKLVVAIRQMVNRGSWIKTIARELGVSRNTVRRYLRQPLTAGIQVRPAARRLTGQWREEARALFVRPAGGNAALVKRLLAERGIEVSVRTVQRTVADIRDERRAEKFERWELDLVKAIADAIRTTDHAALESDLGLHLLQLKRTFRSRIRNWKAFLTTALGNKARNWIRDWWRKERRAVSLDQEVTLGDQEPATLEDLLRSSEADPETRIALALVRKALDPELKEVWNLVMQGAVNQAQVARRLRKHRNTVRLLIRRIQEVLRRHGF